MKIAIIKLASIGDIAIAAKALSQIQMPYEIHWIIDQKLLDLAQTLVKMQNPVFSVHFHPFDSNKLFNGSFLEKAKQGIALAQLVRKIMPSHILLLHRDWRYRFLLRLLNPETPLHSVSRTPVLEYTNYLRVFSELDPSRINQLSEFFIKPLRQTSKKQVGILVGGGSNVKSSYSEKRWPWMKEFLEQISQNQGLLKTTEFYLYGEEKDLEIIEGLETKNFINKIGKLSLSEVAHDLQNLNTFISIDSGLAHIAALVMTNPAQKIFTLFGPTSHKTWAPTPGPSQTITVRSAVDCSPCNSNDGVFRPCRFTGEEHVKCMKLISVNELLNCITS